MSNEVVKDLAYYVEHPEELPSDPAELAALAASDGKDLSEPVVKEAEAQPEPEAKQDVTIPSSGEAKEPEPTGIQSRDGKHVIPYDVLKTERERRMATEAEIQRLREHLAQMEANQASGNKQDQYVPPTPETLDAIRQDFPELGRQFDYMMNEVSTLRHSLTQMVSQLQNERATTAEMTVQSEIDANPTLANWQATRPDLFDAAVAQDNLLRENPAFAHLPLAQRFQKAIEMVSVLYGAPLVTTETPPETENLTEKAQEAVAKAKPSIPNSLSDVRGAIAPEKSEIQRVEDMSAEELGAHLMKMTPDQREKWLAQFTS